MAPFGSYLSNEKLCISEMIDIFSREIGFNKADLLKEFELKRAVNEIFQREIFTIKSCSFDFHIKINKRNFYPIAKNLHLEKLFSYPSILRKVMILINVIRLFGSFMAIKGIMKIIFKRELLPWVHPSSILKVGLRSWPDVNTMDLDENKRCKTGYLLNGQVVSFCYANIVRDRLEI